MTTFASDYEEYIFKSRYARWLDAEGRRENWDETVTRYMTFMRNHLKAECAYEMPQEIYDEVWAGIYNLDVVPSMRAIMTAGPALARDHTAAYNCSFLNVDAPVAFVEAMRILLCGTGVGFSVEARHVKKLPRVPVVLIEAPDTIVVQDSKEGWGDAFQELLTLLWAGIIPQIDYSRIRPAGARLKTFGGRASGPEPLKALFDYTVDLFTRAAGRKLTTTEAHDLMCVVARIVVVGGVRRSAMISLQDLDDVALRGAKTGEFWITNPERALSNNSAVYEDKPARDVFDAEWAALVASGTGERGIFNREASRRQAAKWARRAYNVDYGTNPCCVTGDTLLMTSTGEYTIESLVSKPVFVWTGLDWAPVTPFLAGVGCIIRVVLSNGAQLACTPNHRWVLDNEEFVETDDLLIGDRLAYYADAETGEPVFVKGIVDTGRVEPVYCVTEPTTGRATFNGIVTGNSEIILRPNSFCNLSSVIARAGDTLDDFLRKVRLATILGTWQSTLTNFPTLRPEWAANARAERLLGVSITGIMDCALLNGRQGADTLAAVLEEGRDYARVVNRALAAELGINESAAITCVKPEGTVSQMTNTASGIHARHSPYYIRAVRGDNKDPLTAFLKSAGVPNEPDLMAPDATTVFYWPIKAPDGAITRDDLGAIEQLEMWLIYQRHWTEHKPSVTISVRDDEWAAVGDWVYEHFDEVSGISFLPHSDAVYKQAPYDACGPNRYGDAAAALPKIDWSFLRWFERDDHTTGSQELACSANGCEIL